MSRRMEPATRPFLVASVYEADCDRRHKMIDCAARLGKFANLGSKPSDQGPIVNRRAA
jgi:hypothetical protein